LVPHQNADAVNLPGSGAQVVRVPIAALRAADSPRLEGENPEHTRLLAESEDRLPPILVHRRTMRVIDGVHRLAAAQLRNEETIDVEYFDGTECEAFVLAVRSNTTHGLPLSRVDRTAAAVRIIASHPEWSDRAIAAATGIARRTVSRIRVHLATEHAQPARREGRDGRVRPVDATEGRLKARDVIVRQPDASLREIARQAGISPTTARAVRELVRRGEDPAVPRQQTGATARSGGGPGRPATDGDSSRNVQQDLLALLEGLRNDPQLRFTESGREVLRWLASRAMVPEEWQNTVGKVPPHCTYLIAELARRFSDEWLRFAEDMETRAQRMA
jgi:ParB-like chromosome segregation protein Spo0J